MLHKIDVTKILRTALRQGGDFADIFFEESASTLVACDEEKIDKVLAGNDRGVGIRVVHDFRTAYAFTNDVSEKSLLGVAETLSRAVGKGPATPVIDLRTPQLWPGHPIAIAPETVHLTEKVALVQRADKVARAVDQRIRQVHAVYRDGVSTVQIANSLGEFHETRRTAALFIAHVVAADGSVIQTGYEAVGAIRGFELFTAVPPEEVAEKAAKRAAMMLTARKCPPGTMPVVISAEAGGTMVHEAIGHGLEADLVQAGISVYGGKIGERVASSVVTVIDDATIPHARGSFPFDDEGIPGKKTVLVENGILKSFMYDRVSASKDGTASTGNGRRESYQTKPIVRMTNTLIAPGESDPEEIIRSVPNGLLVKKMGGGQVNTVTGDFVFEVSEGYLIVDGTIAEPVRGATITGNGPAILKNVVKVGNDLGFSIGTCGKEGQGVPVSDAQPTLLISEITVGGAA